MWELFKECLLRPWLTRHSSVIAFLEDACYTEEPVKQDFCFFFHWGFCPSSHFRQILKRKHCECLHRQMQTTDVSVVFSVLTLWHWVISLTAMTPSPLPLNGQPKISLTPPSNEMLFLLYRVLDFMLALYQYFYLLAFWSPLTSERVQRMRLKFPNCKVSKGRSELITQISCLACLPWCLT